MKSTDAGGTFTDISGNLPEVITTAIVQRGNQLIVGTDIGMFISSDLSGSQWAPLGDLPSVPARAAARKTPDLRWCAARAPFFCAGCEVGKPPQKSGSSGGGTAATE